MLLILWKHIVGHGRKLQAVNVNTSLLFRFPHCTFRKRLTKIKMPPRGGPSACSMTSLTPEKQDLAIVIDNGPDANAYTFWILHHSILCR